MPVFKLAFTLVAAAAFAIGKYILDKTDDDDDRTPPRDPHYSSSSHNSGTWSQTRQSYGPSPQSYRPPPPPSYTNRTPAANAHSKTTTRTPAPPDYGQDAYHTSEAFARTPSQSQPSTHTQASRPYSSHFNHVRESPEYEYSHTCSHTSHIYTRSESPLPAAPAFVLSNLHSEKPVIVEDLDFAKKLREQARRRGREMSEARSRAKSAQKKGYRGAAQAHRQEVLAHKSAKEELDKRAAKIIFREKNKNRKEGGMMDLHGLLVAEAIEFAKAELKSAKSRRDEVVRFIVGKGLHAEDGVAKIRPALGAFCTKQGLSHSPDPKNNGVLIVRLDD